MPVSPLRILGIVLALAFLAFAVSRFRSRGSGSRAPAAVLLVLGLGLGLVAALPDVVVPVRDILGLQGEPLGRLVTVLVISVVVGYLLIFFALARADRANQRVSGSFAPCPRLSSSSPIRAGTVGRRARLRPGVRRGGEPARGPRRDPAEVCRLADPRPGDRRRLAATGRPPSRKPAVRTSCPPGQQRPGCGAADRLPRGRAPGRRDRRHARCRRAA